MSIKFEVEALLGFEVVKLTEEEDKGNVFDLEIVEASGQYNKEETISVEKLSDYETYYVMILENGDWCFEGYYKEV